MTETSLEFCLPGRLRTCKVAQSGTRGVLLHSGVGGVYQPHKGHPKKIYPQQLEQRAHLLWNTVLLTISASSGGLSSTAHNHVAIQPQHFAASAWVRVRSS
jgi:hypothetical protein